jgi:UDP-MurNAc hydroxylase
MQLTFLGHAGFLVETSQALVLMDPWLSREGAFASAWMQFPRNHHLAPEVRARLEQSDKARYLYLSHEHKDHYDPAFLATLPRELTVVLAAFRRPVLAEQLRALGFSRVVLLEDGDVLPIPGGHLRLYLTDSVLNRDSALLVHAEGRRFLNLNDCKVHDRLARIVAEDGPIDVFTAQYSGAVWHPICYEYGPAQMAEISRRKMMGKFEAVARAITAVQPRVYLTSAGPACFLDPKLFHLNFQEESIFPRAPRFLEYLERRLRGLPTRSLEAMPGDVLDVDSAELVPEGRERVDEAHLHGYLGAYAAEQADLYAARAARAQAVEPREVLRRLQAALEQKLEQLGIPECPGVPLYVDLEELPHQYLRVDFALQLVERMPWVADIQRYALTVAAADILPVLDGEMNWEDFLLSFRIRLSRIPEAYDATLHGFLALQPEDLRTFASVVGAPAAREERVVVSAGGRRYEIQRFCPHQGADLADAWVEDGHLLVCPRHRWCFDLEKAGRCELNGSSLHAVEVPASAPEPVPRQAPEAAREQPATEPPAQLGVH